MVNRLPISGKIFYIWERPGQWSGLRYVQLQMWRWYQLRLALRLRSLFLRESFRESPIRNAL
jgi:hypothetical protein